MNMLAVGLHCHTELRKMDYAFGLTASVKQKHTSKRTFEYS